MVQVQVTRMDTTITGDDTAEITLPGHGRDPVVLAATADGEPLFTLVIPRALVHGGLPAHVVEFATGLLRDSIPVYAGPIHDQSTPT